MNPILPDRLPNKVAAAIAARIRNGEFASQLPGLRTLARDCRVSVASVSTALRILENDGLLKSGGNRRRWFVAASPTESPPISPAQADEPPVGKRIRRLVFVTGKKLSDLDFTTLEIHANLVSRLNQDGWEVVQRHVRFDGAKRARKRWDEAIDVGPDDALVILTGTRAIGQWAASRGHRVLFVGGTPEGTTATCVAVSATRLLRDSITRLATLGHRRIICPMLGRHPDFVSSIRDGVDNAKELLDGQPQMPEVLIPAHPESSPVILRQMMAKQFHHAPPDALVFLDWAEAVAGICSCRQIGYHIPRDVSLIVLSHTNSMEWHLPAISHYQFPVDHFTRVVRNWALHKHTSASPGGTIYVPAKWVPGESVLDRRPLATL